MKLEECYERCINLAELSRQMGYCRAHVTQVAMKKQKPSKRFLDALEKIPIEKVMKNYSKKSAPAENLENIHCRET